MDSGLRVDEAEPPQRLQPATDQARPGHGAGGGDGTADLSCPRCCGGFRVGEIPMLSTPAQSSSPRRGEGGKGGGILIHGPSCNFDLKKHDAAMLASKVFGLNLPKIRKAVSKFPPMLREGRELGACRVALPIQIVRLRTHDQVAHSLHATCVSCSSGVCSCFVHSVLSRPMRGSLQFASYCISLYRVTSWRLPRKTLRLRFTRLVRFEQNSV